MKKILTVSLILFLGICTISHAQTLDELKTTQADKKAMQSEAQAKADALQGEIDALQTQINRLSGWMTGLSGLVGFDFNKSNGWVASPNPNASSSALNLGVTAYANRESEKTFWNNKGVLTKSWNDVDLTEADGMAANDGLFDNGTVDILNISSLAGYKLSEKFALSALGEMNTSLSNFLKPGTVDIGIGATWRPVENLVIVIHPFNYHIAFPADGLGVDTQGSIGAKLRADYTKDFNLAGKKVAWSSTFTSFIPYSDKKSIFLEGTPEQYEAGLFEYTWLNTLSFEIWKGIGVGVGFGLRNAEFESQDTQSYYSLGLSYGF